MINEQGARIGLEKVREGGLSPFGYLKHANECLSSPAYKSIGREYVIRALDEIDRFEKHRLLLKNLVRKAGLYPYLEKYFSNDSEPDSDFLLTLYQSEFNSNFIFHSMQAKIFNLLLSGRNVVLSAPTSMGKSAIVDSLIASEKFNRVVIVVPTIALIDETRRRITKAFGNRFQVIHHGSQSRRKNRVVYILTQERVNEREDIENIDLFVVDEFYKLAFSQGDVSRVIALNIALSKLLTVSKQFYMIGPYIDAIQGLDSLHKDYVFVPSDFNTVALNLFEYNIKPNDLVEKNHRLKNILDEYPGQTIIYCKSQSSVEQVINSLGRISESKLSKENEEYYEWLKKYYGESWCYTKALKLGAGVHHGVLPRALQQKTIDLFNRGCVNTLVCTSTLIEGVNTVAENVVIYDSRRSNFSIDNFTHKNISGRAGRMNVHLVGNVFCMEALPRNELQANVVDLPIGRQDADTPLNLLASMQNEHLTDQSNEFIERFNSVSEFPIEIIKSHSSYNVATIKAAFSFIESLSWSDLKVMSGKKMPDSAQLDLLSRFIKVAEYRTLQRLNIHFDGNDDLRNRIGWYVYSDCHSSYIRERLDYIYRYYASEELRSEKTDKELKIVRNVFKHAIPRALVLLQDLLNLKFSRNGIDFDADFGYLVHVFENSHLSSRLSALEEMGVAIETLEKIADERLGSVSIEVLSRYLRRNYRRIQRLDSVDKMFVRLALD